MHWKILRKISSKKGQRKIEAIVECLFLNRGLRTKKQKEEFLNPKDPRRLTPKEVGISPVQIIKAIKRIKQAIKNREKIIVYGDYDTDGVCATAILWEALHSRGAQVMPFIPKREEGYGLKVDRIDQLAKEGVKLIVTVDQGIVHSRQVDHAKKVGVDVIITDHHLPGEKKPKALAIVHTTQLSGSAIAWFLAKKFLEKIEKIPGVSTYSTAGVGIGLDLAAIGTVTDVMPLLGPNRSIVKFGLKEVRKTKRLGLKVLYDFAGLDKERIGTYEVGFIIGPRLNAAGRMDDPLESLRLVCTRNKERAEALAQKLDKKNRERQEVMTQTTIYARRLWLKEDGKSAMIFVKHKAFEHGVIGLVARQLMEEFYRPAVVLAPRKDHWVASARSIEEFNIVEAIRACADILGPHGGHRLAAGFSVAPTKIEELKQRLIQIAEERLDKKRLKPTLEVELELELSELSFDLYKQLERFKPFGQGNPQPIFASRQVKVLEAKAVGRENQHLRLELKDGSSSPPLSAIGFGMGGLYSQIQQHQSIDIAYNLLIDEWNNEKRLQLRLRDIQI